MNWQQLLSNKRLGQEKLPHRKDDRTEFQRDYDRLIFSAPFRRLQNKTQVFPLPGSIFVHNRLTHSLEVSSVGRSLGNDTCRLLLERHPQLYDTHLTELGSIVSAACLAHDLGNPPFGHSGEKAIGTYFSEGDGQFLRDYICSDTGDGLTDKQWNDLIHFEGNANAFRLLTHHFVGRREGGFVMTYSTLASIVKYPFSSDLAGQKRKFGFFQSEIADFRKIADELGILCLEERNGSCRYARYPLVYLVEAADDICYEIMDIEDAHKLKIISDEDTSQMLLSFFDSDARERILQRIVEEGVTDKNEKVVYLRACVIGLLESECVRVFVGHEDEILAGSFEGSLIDHISELPREAYRQCSKMSVERIYRSKPVLDVELSGYQIIQTLMEQFIEAAVHPERFYSRQLIGRVSSQYDISSDSLETRLMAVIDYVSGMTDVYALDEYQKISGISLPVV